MAKYLQNSTDIEIEEVTGTENIKFNFANNNSIDTKIGSLSNLQTPDKTNVVSAINSCIDSGNYSTTEVQTNKVWIDDKPIFRKVITFDATTFRNNTNLPTNISNLDNVIKLECIAKSAQDSGWRNIPWLYTSGSSFISAWAGGFFLRDNGNLQFQIGSDLANIDKVFVIIEYTKTTD